MSTDHHDNKINLQSQKPEIIMDYNKNKGGVDTFDHLVELNTCRRKTIKWTLNAFMYVIDCATQNAFALTCMKKKANQEVFSKLRLKSELLVKLSKALINPNIEKRGEQAAVQNYKHVHSPLRNSFKSHGGTVTEIEFQLLPIK